MLILFDFILDCLDWLVGCSEVSHHSSKPRPLEEEEEKRPAMELLRGFLPLGAAVWQCVVHGDPQRQVCTLVHSSKYTGCVFLLMCFLYIVIRRNCLQQRLSDGKRYNSLYGSICIYFT